MTEVDRAWLRRANAWYDAAYPDPGRIDPSLFDRSIYPAATCWFKTAPRFILRRVPEHLALLDRYGVRWRVRRTSSPGVVHYEDAFQLIASRDCQPDAAVAFVCSTIVGADV